MLDIAQPFFAGVRHKPGLHSMSGEEEGVPQCVTIARGTVVEP